MQTEQIEVQVHECTVGEFWDYEMLAAKLRLSTRTVKTLVSDGVIPAVMVGKSPRFRPRDVDAAFTTPYIPPKYREPS